MKSIITLAATATLISLLAIAGLIAMAREPSAASQRLESITLDLAATEARQQSQIAQRQAAQWESIEAAWITPAWGLLGATIPTAGTAVLVLVVVALAAGVLMLVDHYLLNRRPLVWANGGLLPIDKAHIPHLTAVSVGLIEDASKRETARVIASAQPRPRPMVIDHPAIEEIGEVAPSAPVPSFAEMMADGTIGPGKQLVLAWSEDGALRGEVDDLLSTAIAGLQGSGKSSTARYTITSAILADPSVKIALIDPHQNATTEKVRRDSLAFTLAPLSQSFLCQPVDDSDPRKLLATVGLVADELKARKRGASRSWPMMLVIDEFSAIMRHSDVAKEVSTLLEDVATEGRKFRIFAALLGQQWHVSRAGGGELRSVLASAYIHRLPKRIANMIVGMGDLMPQTMTLQTGEAILYRSTGELLRVKVPYCNQSDIEGVARLIRHDSGMNPATARLTSDPAGWVANMPDSCRVERETNQVSAEALHAAKLFMSGATPAEMVLQMRGIRSNQGVTYQKGLDEILGLIREGLGGGS